MGSGRGKSLWNIQTSGRKAAMSSLVFFLTNEIDILKKMVWFFLKGILARWNVTIIGGKAKRIGIVWLGEVFVVT